MWTLLPQLVNLQSGEQEEAGLGVESILVVQQLPDANQFLSSIQARPWPGTSHEETESPVVSIKQLLSPLLSRALVMLGGAVSIQLRGEGLLPPTL